MLNRHSLCKKKYGRRSQMPFFNIFNIELSSDMVWIQKYRGKENKKKYLQNKQISLYETKKSLCISSKKN